MNKICTDINQSKKLLELGIDTKTADLSWTKIYNEAHLMTDYRLDLIPYRFNSGISVPAWSLTALLNLMPHTIIVDNKESSNLEIYKGLDNLFIFQYTGETPIEIYKSSKGNPIDAAVEMLEWLCNNGFLGKEAEK